MLAYYATSPSQNIGEMLLAQSSINLTIHKIPDYEPIASFFCFLKIFPELRLRSNHFFNIFFQGKYNYPLPGLGADIGMQTDYFNAGYLLDKRFQ